MGLFQRQMHATSLGIKLQLGMDKELTNKSLQYKTVWLNMVFVTCICVCWFVERQSFLGFCYWQLFFKGVLHSVIIWIQFYGVSTIRRGGGGVVCSIVGSSFYGKLQSYNEKWCIGICYARAASWELNFSLPWSELVITFQVLLPSSLLD